MNHPTATSPDDPTPPPDPQRRTVLRAALGAAATLGLAGGAQAALAPLKRGIALAHWFEYERNQPVTAAELAGLAASGLDHVRLPFDPLACGWRPELPEVLPFLPELTALVQATRAAGLTLLLDMHLRPDHKGLLESDASFEPALATLWGRLAAAAASLPPEAIAYELFNEPQYYDTAAWRWPVLQRKLLAAVRAVDTVHTVLLSGNRGGSPDGLLGLWPEPDALAAYTFHFYDPFLFTHQGLEWLDERWTSAGTRKGVLYPANLHTSVAPITLRPHPAAAQEWADYLARNWGTQAVRAAIDRVGDWARSRGVTLRCTEFGAIRANADAGSRYRWMQDVRVALEANAIGWTVWDYSHIFGVTAQSALPGYAGRRTIDPSALYALGLKAV